MTLPGLATRSYKSARVVLLSGDCRSRRKVARCNQTTSKALPQVNNFYSGEAKAGESSSHTPHACQQGTWHTHWPGGSFPPVGPMVS